MTDPDNPNPSFTTTLRIRTALTVFLVLLSIALSSCNRDPKSMIVGKWITLDGKESLQFFPDGTMAIATTAGANQRSAKLRASSAMWLTPERLTK